jgi:hypothetical protein
VRDGEREREGEGKGCAAVNAKLQTRTRHVPSCTRAEYKFGFKKRGREKGVEVRGHREGERVREHVEWKERARLSARASKRVVAVTYLRVCHDMAREDGS